jgi:hypothetical protein
MDNPNKQNQNDHPLQPAPISQSQQLPAQKKPAVSIFTKIFLALVGSIVLIIIFFILILGSFFHSFNKDCSARGEKVYTYAQPLTDEFSNTKVISSQPNQNAIIDKNDGDCVDSTPQVRATKEYMFALNTADAAKDINTTLLSQGFTDSSGATSDLCNGTNYTKNSLKIHINLKCTAASQNQQSEGLYALVEITEENIK